MEKVHHPAILEYCRSQAELKTAQEQAEEGMDRLRRSVSEAKQRVLERMLASNATCVAVPVGEDDRRYVRIRYKPTGAPDARSVVKHLTDLAGKPAKRPSDPETDVADLLVKRVKEAIQARRGVDRSRPSLYVSSSGERGRPTAGAPALPSALVSEGAKYVGLHLDLLGSRKQLRDRTRPCVEACKGAEQAVVDSLRAKQAEDDRSLPMHRILLKSGTPTGKDRELLLSCAPPPRSRSPPAPFRLKQSLALIADAAKDYVREHALPDRGGGEDAREGDDRRPSPVFDEALIRHVVLRLAEGSALVPPPSEPRLRCVCR